jgi:hypothetical protein
MVPAALPSWPHLHADSLIDLPLLGRASSR